MNPSAYIPLAPSQFVGSASKLAAIFERKSVALRVAPQAVKVLVIGSPGIGKTTAINAFAASLAGHCTQIESVNGRDVTIERVRQWRADAQYRGLCGGFTVKIVNELDLATPAAQDLLLSYLDELPAHCAFLATSNLNLSGLAERFQTRLQQFRLTPPKSEEIGGLLAQFGIDLKTALAIAERAKGNVRAALLDAQSVLECRELTISSGN